MLQTLVVFGSKWWIHDDCVKLLGISIWLKRTQITLDQIHIRDLKFINVSFKNVQGIIVNVKADAESKVKKVGCGWKKCIIVLQYNVAGNYMSIVY